MSARIKDFVDDELHEVLNQAYSEVVKIEEAWDKVVEKEDEINELNIQPVKGWPGILSVFVGFLLFIVFFVLFAFILGYVFGVIDGETNSSLSGISSIIAAITVVVILSSHSQTKETNRRNTQISVLTDELHNLEAECDETIANYADKIYLIPDKYSNSLALDTMRQYISNMLASTWAECAKLFDEQVYRWKMEQNSLEALELQKYSAMMTELAAKNSSRAATAATISAVSNILK